MEEENLLLKASKKLGKDKPVKSEQVAKTGLKGNFCLTLFKNTYDVGELGTQEKYRINLSKLIKKQNRWQSIALLTTELPFLKEVVDEMLGKVISMQKVDYDKIDKSEIKQDKDSYS